MSLYNIKQWVENEIQILNEKKESRSIMHLVANVQIKLLQRFYNDFNLEEVEEE
jgi:hypothetical protein